MGQALLSVRDLKAGYDKKEIVHGVSLDVYPGEFVCIIGPNGCGKSTLLKNLLGLVKPFAGEVTIDGKAVHEMNERWRAQRFAYIPQAHTPPFPFKVSDVVILGRTPYKTGISAGTSKKDRAIAYRALQQLSIENLADCVYTELSGGQQQLVLIARALVQQPRLLVMDEPTAALDFGNQQLVLSRMHELSRAGLAVIMVTHDPDHALFCADRVVVMEDGTIIDDGTPTETITTENLQRIYHTNVRVADVEVEQGRSVRVCISLMKGRGEERLAQENQNAEMEENKYAGMEESHE